MNQMTSEKYLNFFLLVAFWKFQHFNLESKISQKLFKSLPCHKSIGKMLHAICILLGWASCGPWASCFIIIIISSSSSVFSISIIILIL